MTTGQRLILAFGLVFGGAAAWASTRARGDTLAGWVEAPAPAPAPAPAAPAWTPVESRSWPDISAWFAANQQETAARVPPVATQDPDANVRAFLAAIRQAEGTANRPDPYRVCFGYRHTIRSLADHPAITGEWKGEKLPDNQCRAAGFGPGCVSTAAGAYQIIRPTWERIKGKLKLPDFGPESQHRAAIELLREAGALELINRGDLGGAVSAARRTWASLPGAGYDQPERSLAWVQAAYVKAGGSLA